MYSFDKCSTFGNLFYENSIWFRHFGVFVNSNRKQESTITKWIIQTKKEKKAGNMKKVSTISLELIYMKITSAVYVLWSIFYPHFILIYPDLSWSYPFDGDFFLKKTLLTIELVKGVRRFTYMFQYVVMT